MWFVTEISNHKHNIYRKSPFKILPQDKMCLFHYLLRMNYYVFCLFSSLMCIFTSTLPLLRILPSLLLSSLLHCSKSITVWTISTSTNAVLGTISATFLYHCCVLLCDCYCSAEDRVKASLYVKL